MPGILVQLLGAGDCDITYVRVRAARARIDYVGIFRHHPARRKRKTRDSISIESDRDRSTLYYLLVSLQKLTLTTTNYY